MVMNVTICCRSDARGDGDGSSSSEEEEEEDAANDSAAVSSQASVKDMNISAGARA